MTQPAPRRLHAFFSGAVQGVGFRYTAYGVARGLPVTGWVRNCRDGRVELVAEGAPADLAKVVERIKDAMSGYIDDVNVFHEAATGEFGDFQIAPTF